MKALFKLAIVAALLLPGVASADLIHSYDFNGNANDSVGDINGQVAGDATLITDRFGNFDSAYSFSGSGAIAMQIASPETVSYSMWASWSDGIGNDMLFNTGDDHKGPDIFFVGRTGCDALHWNIWDNCSNQLSKTPASATDGNYHHYALVNELASNMAFLYYDGELIGTADYREAGDTFTVGSEWLSTYVYGWTGAIDDVKIYDHALSAMEVVSMFSTSLELSEANAQQAPVPVPAPLMLSCLMLGGMMLRKRS
jgi:hypothetical protein